MRLAVLAARTGWHTQQLERAAAARGHQAVVLPYEGLVATIGPDAGLRSNGTDLDAMDLVFARIIPSGSLEQIIFRVDALHRLEDRGVKVMNSPRAIERTVDKFWTSALLEQCGISTPETMVCEAARRGHAAFRMLRRHNRQAAVRIHGAWDGAGAGRGDGVPGISDASSRSGASITCSARWTTKEWMSGHS